MVQEPVDMRLTEAFHRLKRTTMIFSGALAMLGLAVPAAESVLSFNVVELRVPVTVTAAALWLGALYYLIGFLIELRLAVRLNTTVMLSEGAKSYESELHRSQVALKRAVASFLDRLERSASEAKATAKELDEQDNLDHRMLDYMKIDRAAANLEKLIVGRQDKVLRNEDVVAMMDSLQNIRFDTAKPAEDYSAFVNRIQTSANTVADLRDAVDAIAALLGQTHRDFTKLSSTIAIERRLGFWMWECGGAVILFLFASGLARARLWEAVTAIHLP